MPILYHNNIKSRAVDMRKQGLTHREIKKKLGIGLGTAWLWTKDVILTAEQKGDIQERCYKPTLTKERRHKLRELARINFESCHKGKYTKNDLINKIKDFYEQHGRIPLKKEFNMYGEYKRHFTSWNEAISSAGFEPNPIIFSKKFIAKDGHICDSFAEKLIDDWLFQNNIKHERNFPYPKTKMTADFAVGRIRIEYFGLAGEIESYDKIIEKKRKFCLMNNLKLVEIYPNDLFSKNFKKCFGNVLKEIRRNYDFRQNLNNF